MINRLKVMVPFLLILLLFPYGPAAAGANLRLKLMIPVQSNFLPAGVGVDSAGDIYVANGWTNYVMKYDSSGNFLCQWNTDGQGDSFLSLSGVAVDSKDNIYVVDTDGGVGLLGLVYKFYSNGNSTLVYFESLWTQFASYFYYPEGVALDGSGDIYLADTFNDQIQKLSSSGATSQWGGSGTGNGQFNLPSGVAVDRAGNVYVTDTNNDRIQKFDGSGHYLAQWPDGQFTYPGPVAVDPGGNVYVGDAGGSPGRIQKFTPGGRLLGAWTSYSPGNYGFGVNGLAVAHGNLYVSDNTLGNTSSGRVLVFQAPGSSLPWLNLLLDDSHIIKVIQAAGGTISPPGPVTVKDGASQTFYFIPNPGFRVAAVLVDGSSVGAVTSYTFTHVSADHTITASFAINIP